MPTSGARSLIPTMSKTTASRSLFDKIMVIMAFIPLAVVIYPHPVAAAYAAQTANNSLVFEINSKANTELNQNISLASYEDLVANDPLVKNLRVYLEKHNSPLAEYAPQIVLLPQWQRALAISWVESNFGRRCADNNCSGIGVAPGHPAWRKYPTKLAWFEDMTALLEKPIYKERFTNCNTMKGVYVVPGSANWVNGCTKKSQELMALTVQSEQERLAMINSAISVATTELAMK
jgi:hypothetical protein